MKQQQSNRNILLGISFCIVLAFSAMAFQDSSKINKQVQESTLDTVPKNHEIDINIDLKEMEEIIKKSMEMAQKKLQNIDFTKMQKQIEQSMKQIDMAKLQMEINNSIKAIDWKKIQTDIDRSMKDIDMSKIQMNIEKDVRDAMKNINTAEIKKSMEEVKKINFDDVKKEMENVKKEMELNKDHFKLDMDKLKIDMEKVKIEMGEIKHMTDEMEKDGLINKTESNSIDYKDKQLIINGKKQSPEITEKYRKYFKGDNFKFKFNGN
jgi:hypothetical protein